MCEVHSKEKAKRLYIYYCHVSGEVVGVREAGGCVCVSVCPVSCVRRGGGGERGRRVCVCQCVSCVLCQERWWGRERQDT